MKKELGSGTYGTVIKARHIPTKKRVAIKKLVLKDDDMQTRLIYLIREVTILTKMNGTGHTTDIVEFFVNDEAVSDYKKLSCVFIVMELYAFDLKELLMTP